MSAMRVLVGLLAVAAVAGAVYFLTSGDDAADPVAVGRSERAAADAGPVEAPALASGASSEGAAPTRSVADVEGLATPSSDAPAATASKAGVRVHGRVVDEGNRPVARATVRLRPGGIPGFHADEEVDRSFTGLSAEVETGPDGRFSFEEVREPSKREVFVRAASFVDATADIPHREGDVDLGDVRVEIGGSLAGRVVDDAGNPVPDAEVRAWTRSGPKPAGPVFLFGDIGGASARRTRTDGAGAFRFDGLRPGEVTAVAAAEGYTPQSRQGLVVKRGELTADVRIAVSLGEGIQGVVVDADGRAIAGAEVWYTQTVVDLTEGAVAGSLAEGRYEATDGDGRFRVTGLREGTYNLTARHDGHVSRAVTAVETGTSDLRITLAPSGLLWGHVRNARTGDALTEVEIGLDDTMAIDLGAFIVAGRADVLRGAEAAQAAGVDADPALYAIRSLDAERVGLVATKDGFAPFRRGGIDVPAGSRTRFDVELVPEATISGVVLDPGGVPVAEATVSVAPRSAEDVDGGMRFARRVEVRGDGGEPEIFDGSERKQATTDAEGRFTVRGLEAGDYSVSATHREWARSESSPLTLGEDGVDSLEVVLRRGGRLVGTAYDAEGNLLRGGTVRLKKSAGGAIGGPGFRRGGPPPGAFGDGPFGDEPSGETDADGRYEITGILPGPYLAELTAPTRAREMNMIVFAASGGAEKGTPVTIEEGETATLDLSLPPTGGVRGRVTEAGRPLAGVSVSVSKSDAMIPGFGGPSERTDSDGRYELADLEPGKYQLTVAAKGAPRPIIRSIEIDARRTLEEDVDLPTGVIAGRVTDVDSGLGVEDVVIEVTPADEDEDAPAPAPVARAAFVAISASTGASSGVRSFTIGNEDQSVRTDADGRYEVRYLDPNDYRVEIRGGGVEPQTKDRVRVATGGRTDGVDFEATRGATLVARARLPDGEAPQFLRGELRSEATGSRESQMEFGAPKITFEGLAPGTYEVTLSAGDLRGGQTVTIASGEEKEITVDLE